VGTSCQTRVGFVGVGAMGAPMARNLLRAGHTVIAFDLSADRLKAVASDGAEAASDAPDVVGRADVVLTSLRSSEAFADVAWESFVPNAREGQLFIDLGTTAAPDTRAIAAALAERGAALVDAPVSGGPGGAASGTLHIFVGGAPAAVERAMPILEILGGRVTHCGPSGAGQVVKGVNQLAMGLTIAAYLEAIAFAVRAGVAPETVGRAVGGEEEWRRQVEGIAQAIAAGNGSGLTVKFPELRYFLKEADEKGFPLPLTHALLEFCDRGEHRFLDNMNRPEPSFWHELSTRPKGS